MTTDPLDDIDIIGEAYRRHFRELPLFDLVMQTADESETVALMTAALWLDTPIRTASCLPLSDDPDGNPWETLAADYEAAHAPMCIGLRAPRHPDGQPPQSRWPLSVLSCPNRDPH